MTLSWASVPQLEFCLVSKRGSYLHSTYDSYILASFPENQMLWGALPTTPGSLGLGAPVQTPAVLLEEGSFL